jgi:ABC-type amino acid transport substrate-binding protein
MASKSDMRIATFGGVIALGLALLCPAAALSQDTGAAPHTFTVGVIEAPPFATKAAGGPWTGLSVELWQAVALRLGAPFTFQQYDSLNLAIEALQKGEIDILPFLNVNVRYEDRFDFSHAYLRSGLTIAVPAEPPARRGLQVIQFLYSRVFIGAMLFLVCLSLIAGTILWALERRANPEMFDTRFPQGIGQGLWWAVVTMTTVGYGDKAPRTAGGRIVATIWMLASLILIAVFTAHITASMTVSELRGKVSGFNDLPNVRVGSGAQSDAAQYLTSHGISVTPFPSMNEGLQALTEHRIDAFVQNEAVLKHLVMTAFPGQINVIPGTFDHYFVSFAFAERSPYRKPINKALLKFMSTEDWDRLLQRYLE